MSLVHALSPLTHSPLARPCLRETSPRPSVDAFWDQGNLLATVLCTADADPRMHANPPSLPHTPIHRHTRYVMRSRGGGHALLGSTDWAVAVRPCMYACMCPATLAHSRLMHACLTLTLTCGSDYSDGVAPMPHACMHGLTQSLRHRALRAHAHASFTVALIPPYASADYSITRTLIFEAWVMQAIRQRMQGLHLPLGSTPS